MCSSISASSITKDSPISFLSSSSSSVMSSKTPLKLTFATTSIVSAGCYSSANNTKDPHFHNQKNIPHSRFGLKYLVENTKIQIFGSLF
ncbi:hypothetical protein GEMRC1_012623 [Eukaryota sp. GEM-RC1]